MLSAGEICLERSEHFQKGSYRNRYRIAGPNGQQRLSIPLLSGKHAGQDIDAVRMAYTENWPLMHWRSIQTAYGKSPFFEHYADELKSIIMSRDENLWTWNKSTIAWSLEQLDVDCKIEMTNSYEAHPDGYVDLRNRIHPKAKNLLPNAPEYPQVFQEKNGFLANLSILDLIFCQGPLAIQYLEKLQQTLQLDLA